MHAAEQDSQTVQKHRAQWAATVAQQPANHFVFLDESGITTEMTRRYGRGLGGQRVPEGTPSHGRTLPVLCAISLSGWVATMTIEAPTDGDVFLTYLEQVLCPQLRPGQVVVMDNLSAHQVEGVRARIEATGARLSSLPPYSPDFNPIERCWAQLKQHLRAHKARTVTALEAALTSALHLLLPSQIAAYFRGCGYYA